MLFPYNFDTINYFNVQHYICFNRNKLSSHARKYIAMWAYGRHSCVECVDVKRKSLNCGIMVEFKESS